MLLRRRLRAVAYGAEASHRYAASQRQRYVAAPAFSMLLRAPCRYSTIRHDVIDAAAITDAAAMPLLAVFRR